MRLRVNPNRMELLRLRRRLQIAERGHKLLKDKLEESMRQFLEKMSFLLRLQEEVMARMEKILLAFSLARTRQSAEKLEKLLGEGMLVLEARKERILNLTVPRFEILKMEISAYDFLNTESELDIGIKKTKELLPHILEMARLWKAVELLAKEIETTRRRVNALEHILIPSIKETIQYISGRLEEIERAYQFQLMRVKEIVRGH